MSTSVIKKTDHFTDSSSSYSPVTFGAVDVTGESPDTHELTTLLQNQRPGYCNNLPIQSFPHHSTVQCSQRTLSPSSSPSTSPSQNHTHQSPPTGPVVSSSQAFPLSTHKFTHLNSKSTLMMDTLRHRQKVVLPVNRLTEIPPPSSLPAAPVLKERADESSSHFSKATEAENYQQNLTQSEKFQGILQFISQQQSSDRTQDILETTTAPMERQPTDGKKPKALVIQCKQRQEQSAYLDPLTRYPNQMESFQMSHDSPITGTTKASHDHSNETNETSCSSSPLFLQQSFRESKPGVTLPRNNKRVQTMNQIMNKERQNYNSEQQDTKTLKVPDEEVVCKGYQVLKEVKQSRSAAETQWNLAECQDDWQFLDQKVLLKKAPCFGCLKEEGSKKLGNKCPRGKTMPGGCGRPCHKLHEWLKHETPYRSAAICPTPDMTSLYHYMTTGLIPTIGIPVYVHGQCPETGLTHEHEASKSAGTEKSDVYVDWHGPPHYSPEEVGVFKDKGIQHNGDKPPCLEVQVLSSIDIQSDDKADMSSSFPCKADVAEEDGEDTSEDNITTEDVPLVAPLDSSDLLHSPGNGTDGTAHPFTLSAAKKPSSLTSLPPKQSPTLPSSCLMCQQERKEEQKQPSADVSQKMQEYLHIQAQKWVQKELMTRVLALHSSQMKSGCNYEVSKDATTYEEDHRVVELIKEVLFEQAKDLLYRNQLSAIQREEWQEKEEEGEEGELRDGMSGTQREREEYSFSFDSYSVGEDSTPPAVAVTPQPTPPKPSSPVPVEQTSATPPYDSIPTPQQSPVFASEERQEPFQEETLEPEESFSTPEQTIGNSDQPIQVATPSSTNLSLEKDRPVLNKESTSIPLSLTDTTPTSIVSSPPTNDGEHALSTSLTSTENEISYGQRVGSLPVHNTRQNISISEGEAPLSPGDVRWKTQVPMKMKLYEGSEPHLKGSTEKGMKSHYLVSQDSRSQLTTTSLGEVKRKRKLKTRTGNSFDQLLTTFSTSTPETDSSFTQKDTSLDEDDTFADVPSMNEISPPPPSRPKEEMFHNLQGPSDSNSLSPGEVRRNFDVLKTSGLNEDSSAQSLSEGEVPEVLRKHQVKNKLQFNKTQELSEGSSVSIDNKTHNGIDVIDISHSSQAGLLRDRRKHPGANNGAADKAQRTAQSKTSSSLQTPKNLILISSEEPGSSLYESTTTTLRNNGVLGNQLVQPPKDPLKRSNSDSIGHNPLKEPTNNGKRQGPVILLERSNEDDEYSFTFSSISVPLPN